MGKKENAKYLTRSFERRRDSGETPENTLLSSKSIVLKFPQFLFYSFGFKIRIL